MKNNINYIFKKVVSFFIIFILLTFIKSCEVHALTYQSQLLGIDTTMDYLLEYKNITTNNNFKNFGKGKIIFSIQYSPSNGSLNINRTIDQIRINTSDGSGWSCEIGNISTYWEDVKYVQVISPVCYINVSNNVSVTSISFRAKKIGNQGLLIRSSDIWTFIEDSTYNDSNVISAIQSMMSQNLIIHNENRVDSQSIVNAINGLKTSQENLEQQQIQQQQQTNQKLDETNDFLKDSSLPDNSSGDIGDLNNNIATNGTISSLVTMPITFIQKIINGLNGSCSPITIGELYNYNMTMPCINPQQYIGVIWNIIDVICAGFLSFHFSKKLVSIFHKVTSMKDGGLEEAYD